LKTYKDLPPTPSHHFLSTKTTKISSKQPQHNVSQQLQIQHYQTFGMRTFFSITIEHLLFAFVSARCPPTQTKNSTSTSRSPAMLLVSASNGTQPVSKFFLLPTHMGVMPMLSPQGIAKIGPTANPTYCCQRVLCLHSMRLMELLPTAL
jgi:hypothetical protein